MTIIEWCECAYHTHTHTHTSLYDWNEDDAIEPVKEDKRCKRIGRSIRDGRTSSIGEVHYRAHCFISVCVCMCEWVCVGKNGEQVSKLVYRVESTQLDFGIAYLSLTHSLVHILDWFSFQPPCAIQMDWLMVYTKALNNQCRGKFQPAWDTFHECRQHH